MEYRTLGKTGLRVSEISLGCWTIGGLNFVRDISAGWQGADDGESLAGMRRGYELGVNHFDTADVYGNGHSERLVGRFLKDVPRDSVIIATKVGWLEGSAPHRLHPLKIQQQFETSLYNLGTDYVDIYYFHNTDFGLEDEYLDDAAELMHRFRDEGKVRFIGQSGYEYEDFLRVHETVRPDVLQFRYNALFNKWDDPETDLFAWADARNLGMVLFGPLAQGALLGKYTAASPPAFEPGDNRARNEWFTPEGLAKLGPAMKQITARFGETAPDLVQMALQYCLHRSQNAVAIPGFRNPAQVGVNVAAAGNPLGVEDVRFIRETLNFAGRQ